MNPILRHQPLFQRPQLANKLASAHRLGLSLVLASALALASGPLQAKTLRWASAGELPSWDPHSQNNALSNGVHAWVYESLVYYNKKFELEPMLATKWELKSPTQMRLYLRKGVKFHDGSPFSADDVVFSVARVRDKLSNFGIYAQGISDAVKIDEHTVDILLDGPNPVLLRQLTEVRIMSKTWSEKNNSIRPKDTRIKDETFAHRNTNGTGPMMLKEWQPDVKSVLVRNPNWWGKLEDDITEVIYQPIKADATRTAALLTGEVDMILDPAPQDTPRLRQNDKLKVIDGAENRTIFIGMDQSSAELPGSDVKGKNPLKDVRVRKALYQAIDIEGIKRSIMRGQSQPTGAIIATQVYGWNKEADKRLPFDVEAAKKLLSTAGYPNGFEMTMDCPNNRYINDEEICQSVVAMWTRIGVRAKLKTQPMSTYFPMLLRFEPSVYLLGWGVPTFDALYSLQSLARTKGVGGDGNYNIGRYSNPQMDALIERIKRETDEKTRADLIAKALNLHNEEVVHIPLHNQVIPWAMKKTVTMVHRADNRVDIRWVKIQ
jgi:peptide/nickel transport system substrate-binding protein